MLSNLNTLKLTIFGESHGAAIGMTLEGIPAGYAISVSDLQSFADRRKSISAFSTPRREADKIELISGIKDGYTTGMPICAIIVNGEQKSADYSALNDIPRPSHCDYAARVKYGDHCDLNGGGRFSGRLTAPLCIAGGIAAAILKEDGIEVAAYVSELGGIALNGYKKTLPKLNDIREAQKSDLPVLPYEGMDEVNDVLAKAVATGDSLGGVVDCIAYGVPIGLGGALYDGLEGRIASMIFAIPAVKGVEFGDGFDIAKLAGSAANDAYCIKDGAVALKSNRSGGINGGISNGGAIALRAAFRPTPSIAKEQDSVNLKTLSEVKLSVKGRHDVCIVPRAVVCVEAAVAICLLDCLQESKLQKKL